MSQPYDTMNAQHWNQTSGAPGLRYDSHLTKTPERRARVVVFGSFLGGYHVLSELLFGDLADRVTIVGVATDDPTQPWSNAKGRLWKYPHTETDEMLVRRFANSQNLPVFTGRVKSPEFHDLMVNHWKPDLCLMATFGQKIPKHIIDVPGLGFFNFHHSGPNWPSYPGPDPIAAMQRAGLTHLVLTMHRVNELIDDGEFFARSHPVAIPQGINAIDMHRISWPQMGRFIRTAVGRILDEETIPAPDFDTMMFHEDSIPYFAMDRPKALSRLGQELDDYMINKNI